MALENQSNLPARPKPAYPVQALAGRAPNRMPREGCGSLRPVPHRLHSSRLEQRRHTA
jgi:hypothetical protein